MTDLSLLAAAISGAGLPAPLWQLLVLLLLVSPNIASLATHGTADLLAAHGYTMEQWIEERRAS